MTTITSFGQGYFSFTGSTRGVWDCFSSSPRLASDVNIAFLWGTGSSALSALYPTGVPTNSVNIGTTAQIWTAITTDPNYTIAVNSGTSAQVQQLCAANGSWSYNSGNAFGITGTTPDTTYTVIVFGWSSAYPTIAAAAAAPYPSPVGWSAPFSYTTASSVGSPLTMPASGLLPFGVIPVVPEPTTLTLVFLGGLSLLALRHKNSSG